MRRQPGGVKVFTDGPEERLREYYERMSEPNPLRATTKAGWLRRRAFVRERTLSALGLDPMPDRVPLAVLHGGALERGAYRVERVYWQTWPKVWAAGRLYTPTAGGVLPGVVCAFGGGDLDSAAPCAQSLLISLACLGYAALAIDSTGVCDLATGLTPLSGAVLQCLRALDLLASRPEVDRERLGITGFSGGALAAMHVLAVDDRPRAVVLQGGVGYLRDHLSAHGEHAPATLPPGILRFTDGPELCGVGSPRALLLLPGAAGPAAADGARASGELRALYHLWGQPDRLCETEWSDPPPSDRRVREDVYQWLERELKGTRNADRVVEPAHAIEPREDLDALDAAPTDDRGEAGIVEWHQKRTVAQPPQLESRQARRSYQDRVRAELLDLLGGEPEPASLDARPSAGSQWPPGVHSVSFRSERDVRVPAAWLPGTGRTALVILHPDGKEAAVALPQVRELSSLGWSILAADVRLRGEMLRAWSAECLAWGRPEAGMAAQDARACVQWLMEEHRAETPVVVLAGLGDQGLTALLAAAMDERVAAVAADCCRTTYRDGGEGLPVIPNVLRVADVPQIASLTAPRPLWLFGVPEARVGFSSRRYFDWTRRTFQSLGDVDALKMTGGGLPAGQELAGWLEQRLRRSRRL